MILLLPDKHMPVDRSLIGLGSLLLRHLESPATLSNLWDRVREKPEVRGYREFVLTLAYLHAIGAVGLNQGFLVRTEP